MKSKSRYRRAHSDWATRQLAIQQECEERAWIGRLEYAHESGVTQGMAQGVAQGMAQGVAQGRQEGERLTALKNARKMKADGVSPELIERWTGINAEELL